MTGERVAPTGRDGNVRAPSAARGYLRACLLLLAAERPVHGYEVLARLRDLSEVPPDTAAVYRTLRRLDRDGLMRSWWAPSTAGPARRLYRATDAGVRCLAELTAELEQRHQDLSTYLRRHRALAQGADGMATAR